MAYNQKKKASNEKWDKENMVIYSVKYSNKIYELVVKAIEESNTNRNAWTVNAIVEKLKRDGYIE